MCQGATHDISHAGWDLYRSLRICYLAHSLQFLSVGRLQPRLVTTWLYRQRRFSAPVRCYVATVTSGGLQSSHQLGWQKFQIKSWVRYKSMICQINWQRCWRYLCQFISKCMCVNTHAFLVILSYMKSSHKRSFSFSHLQIDLLTSTTHALGFKNLNTTPFCYILI